MTKTTSLVIDVDLYQKLRRKAFDSDQTISAVLDGILRKEFPTQAEQVKVDPTAPVKPADIEIDWGKQ